MTVPISGLLLEHCKQRYVIGAAKKRFETDGLSISGISGIGHTSGSPRKAKACPFSVNLASAGVVRVYECEEQRVALLGARLLGNDCPGRTDDNGKFHPASPISLPLSSSFTQPTVPARLKSDCRVFGLRKTKVGMETVIVPARIRNHYDQGVVIALPDGDIECAEFGGAPILDSSNRLIAVGLFAGRLIAGSQALVGLSTQMLMFRAMRMMGLFV